MRVAIYISNAHHLFSGVRGNVAPKRMCECTEFHYNSHLLVTPTDRGL